MSEFAPQWKFDLVNINSLSDPQTRSGVPDLEECLAVWLETGDLSLLRFRVDFMSRSHLAPTFVMNAYGYVHENKKPFLIVQHEPSFSAGDNAGVLMQQGERIRQALGTDKMPEVLKTVSLGFPSDQLVLVSGIGDFRLDHGVRASIGAELGVTRADSRRAIINPPDFDTTLYLGLQPGMVKPILEPHLVGDVDGICYLKDRALAEDFVAISVSHVDSMIMQVRDFEFLFADYAKDNYMDFSLTSTEAFDFYKNERAQR